MADVEFATVDSGDEGEATADAVPVSEEVSALGVDAADVVSTTSVDDEISRVGVDKADSSDAVEVVA